MSAIAISGALSGCSSGDPVTHEALAAARQTWQAAGPKSYDLEWRASGISSSHYYVSVRDGTVRSVQSVGPDGQRHDLHPAEPRFYGVDGLFTTIADELIQLKSDRPFGQPAGTRVVMRFRTDPKLGYPLSYRRDVLGTSQGLAIEVIRLVPIAPGSSSRSDPV